MDPARHVVLTGPMGVGKTTVGEMVADRLGFSFLDSDEILATKHGADAGQIAAAHGVAYLHRVEADVVATAIERDAPAVIAAAASIGDRPDLLGKIIAAGHLLILLTGDPADHATPPEGESHRRPIPAGEAARLGTAREELVRGVGGVVVNTRRRSPTEVAAELADLARSAWA